MSSHCTSPEAAKRRSERLLLQIPVMVRGKTGAREPFQESTRTLVINAHGALLALATPVVLRQMVALENVATGAERESCVVFVGDRNNGHARVGVEFVIADPDFWNIEFPPSDWKPAD